MQPARCGRASADHFDTRFLTHASYIPVFGQQAFKTAFQIFEAWPLNAGPNTVATQLSCLIWKRSRRRTLDAPHRAELLSNGLGGRRTAMPAPSDGLRRSADP